MNRAQNFDRGFGVNPARAWIPLLGCSHGFGGAGFQPVGFGPCKYQPPQAGSLRHRIPLEHGWRSIFAWVGIDLVSRIRGNRSLSKGQQWGSMPPEITLEPLRAQAIRAQRRARPAA